MTVSKETSLDSCPRVWLPSYGDNLILCRHVLPPNDTEAKSFDEKN